jgi:phosphoglycolate phosphatase-like HAD superfamily hydrolase
VHLAVFDIDGTLVDSDEFDGRLYAEAISTVLGFDIDRTWANYNSVTDSGILNEILDGIAPSLDRREAHQRVKSEFIRLTQRYVERTPEALREVPGARGLVEMLEEQPSITVAIATGGWRETAELKLRGIGLDPDRLPVATASDSPDRREIIRIAEIRALNGEPAHRRTYFGDGAWDKKAAEELSYAFVAVGNAVPHDIVLQDLADHAKVLAYLER